MTDAPVAKRGFHITANQITVARILLLPFPCWALIARPDAGWMWAAFVFGALVGATDFVDGWLARRDGPTVLGSLLDPVADKLFIAMLLLPEVAHGECPGWAAAALFVRELWITALRTSLSVRKQSLKTSQLGKLKTVVQMGGIAAFFLTLFVPGNAMPWAHFICASAVLLFGVIMAIVRKAMPPSWVLGAAPLWYGIFVSAFFLEPPLVAFLVFMAMVSLTWVSGADYFWGAGKILKREGIKMPDVARTVWAIVHGIALIPLIGDIPELVIPVITILCAELSLGGIDNIVSAQRGRFAKGSVWPTTLASIAVGACAWFHLVSQSSIVWMAWALAAFSLVNLVAAFVLDREVFFAPDRPLSDA
jgi:CDP-diacylglycerol--glycerol-3-phosphate 3-phosphatidyltransferase